MKYVMIGTVKFPEIALSLLRYARDIYSSRRGEIDVLQIESPGISTPMLVSIREFMEMFPSAHVLILLPRMKPVKQILGDNIWEWINRFDIDGLKDLQSATHILGYSSLFDIVSLVLSEYI